MTSLFHNNFASLAITHLHYVQTLLHGRQQATINVVDALHLALILDFLDVGSLYVVHLCDCSEILPARCILVSTLRTRWDHKVD